MATDEEFKQFNRPLIEEFRANAGKVSGWSSLLLLTTVGAKRGEPHTTPLLYSMDGDRMIVIAAALGAPKHPAWYFNLLAHPDVIVELDGASYHMRAVVAEGQERERLFNQHAQQVPENVEFQEKAHRLLPVVLLERIG